MTQLNYRPTLAKESCWATLKANKMCVKSVFSV